VLLVLAAALLAAGVVAVNASAIVVPATASQSAVGFFPSIGYVQSHHVACTTSCSALLFHSGGVVQHGEREYMVFWMPAGHYMPPSYRSGLSTFLSDYASADYLPGNPFSVAQQYSDKSGPGGALRFVPYALVNGGVIVDTNPYPASACTDPGTSVCLSDAQIQTEIKSVVQARGLPENLNTEYTLFTPVGVGSCFTGSSSCAYTTFCGYHGVFNGASGPIVYANMPWAYMVNGCDVNMAFGTGFANGSAIDPEVGVWSHELIETMTDVQLNAWYDSSGNEIGDKCAYNYNGTTLGSMTGLPNNGLGFWDTGAAGDEYLLQTEFSNRNSNGSTTGCVIKDTDTQPVVTTSIVPNPPVHGSSAQFTATVTDPAGVNLVQWSFGDGTSATGNPVNHTYTTAGAKTLVVIVTDGHGNEKKVTQTITVS
jgi:hypothetical protein